MDCSSPGSSAIEFARQEYWSGLPLPSLGFLPNPEIQPPFPVLTGNSFPLSHQDSPTIVNSAAINIRVHVSIYKAEIET